MRKRGVVFGPVVLLAVLAFAGGTEATIIAEITEDVTTDFGVYHPYPAAFAPRVPTFSVEPDFSNVVNFSHMRAFSSADSTLLLRNHFTVKYTPFTQLYDVYNECTWDQTPIFVTTDAVLHTYHVLFDRMLAEIEVQRFVEALDILTETLIGGSQSMLSQSTTPECQEAAVANLAFLWVANKLLGAPEAAPGSVSDLVDAELALVSNAGGYEHSPIFGDFSELDYSQFTVRGHYTKSETLKAYFKTMMWYGWTIFTMEPGLFDDLAARHTLQALMLVQMLYNLEANGEPLLDLWEGIYEPTVFFVGKTDDPSVPAYKAIAEAVYGPGFLSLSPDDLADSALLETFMAQAQELLEPKIPNWIYGTFETYKGFRFMGQRFIPDSYMFAHLVDPYVWLRYMPRGLDVLAILGSERAYTLLDSVYDETSYEGYSQAIVDFQVEFEGKSAEDWAQNLYWNWLYCLMPLLYEKGPGYPFFMQAAAWSDKEVLTALASWAELRHDTILYAKQSTTPFTASPPSPPRSYVEPNPRLYARLASLVRYTREGLQGRDLLLEGFGDKLDLFETLLLFLRDVSIKELENTPLSDSEYHNIFCFGRAMESLVSVPTDPQRPWEGGDTDDMAVIADVHTDSYTEQCLEEGVGYPLEIFVIVNEGGVTRVTRGAIFSYYEFTQPITDRLTDEAWREMLKQATQPDMPEWVSSFMDVTVSPTPPFPDFNPANLYSGGFTAVETEESNPIPEALQLWQNHPNPFNPVTSISFTVPDHAQKIVLTVYNLRGQKVLTLVDVILEAGVHTTFWDGKDGLGRQVGSGVYLCRMVIEDGVHVQARKMVLLR